MGVGRSDGSVPGTTALAVHLVARATGRSANREQERRGPRVVVRERSHELGERDTMRPFEPEHVGRVAQASQAMLVDLRHHPEHAGLRRHQRIGDSEVGRQRERRVLFLGSKPRPEAQGVVAVVVAIDLLLREVESGGAAPLFGDDDATMQFSETLR